MKRYLVAEKFSVISKPNKWLSQAWKADDYFMKAEIKGVENGIEGKDSDKKKTGNN